MVSDKKPPVHILVANEIVSTEKTFVEQMEIMRLVFISPLRSGKILPATDISAIFSNVETLHGLCLKLLNDLQKDQEQHREGGREVGKIFKEFAPFFKMFTMYLNNYENAIKVKQNLYDSNYVFREFLDHAEQDPRCKGMNLNSYLITPVQRVPRYKLLLEELLKKTPETEGDYALIKEAFELVKESAKHKNSLFLQSSSSFFSACYPILAYNRSKSVGRRKG